MRVGMFTYDLESDRSGVPASVARKLLHKLGRVPTIEQIADSAPLPQLPPLAQVGSEHLRETIGLIPLRTRTEWLVMEEKMSSVGLWSTSSVSKPLQRSTSLPALRKPWDPPKVDISELERLRRQAEEEADTLARRMQQLREEEQDRIHGLIGNANVVDGKGLQFQPSLRSRRKGDGGGSNGRGIGGMAGFQLKPWELKSSHSRIDRKAMMITLDGYHGYGFDPEKFHFDTYDIKRDDRGNDARLRVRRVSSESKDIGSHNGAGAENAMGHRNLHRGRPRRQVEGKRVTSGPDGSSYTVDGEVSLTEGLGGSGGGSRGNGGGSHGGSRPHSTVGSGPAGAGGGSGRLGSRGATCGGSYDHESSGVGGSKSGGVGYGNHGGHDHDSHGSHGGSRPHSTVGSGPAGAGGGSGRLGSRGATCGGSYDHESSGVGGSKSGGVGYGNHGGHGSHGSHSKHSGYGGHAGHAGHGDQGSGFVDGNERGRAGGTSVGAKDDTTFGRACGGDIGSSADARGGKQGRKAGKGKRGKNGDEDEELDDPEARERARLSALAIDWPAIAKALPLGSEDEDVKRRQELFSSWDVNSNGGLSYTEVDRAMRELMVDLTPGLVGKGKGVLFEWNRSWKPVIMRAFNRAQDFNAARKAKPKRNDNYVERDEFRLLLVCIRQYFELFIAFCRIDVNIDRKIDKEEFSNSLPELRKWGIDLADDQVAEEFEKIDTDNSGAVLFDEFIRWALEKKLDLDDDDDDLADVYLSEMVENSADRAFM